MGRHVASDEELMRRADVAAANYRKWAADQKAKGDDEGYERLNKKAAGIDRRYGSNSPPMPPLKSGSGCALLLVALAAMPAGAWEITRVFS